MNLLSVTYENNTKIPGQGHLYGSGDRLLLSIGRGKTEKMTFEEKWEAKYEKEHVNHFSYTVHFTHLAQLPLGDLRFETLNGKTYNPYITTSVGLDLRLATNEQFFQLQKNRYPLHPEAPVYELKYTLGTIGTFGGDTFHKLEAVFKKRWFGARYGFLDVWIDGGKVFNTVPFPSLFVVHANQDLSFQEEAFNSMRFFEFVAEQYVAVRLAHCFNGFFFNRIPLIKNLKWREIITFKAIYGSVSNHNIPNDANGLMVFPHNEQGQLTTFPLGKEPFMEAGVAIDNIFSYLRIDLVKRLNYLDNPGIREWSVRALLHFTF
jgi:hypothetical protein